MKQRAYRSLSLLSVLLAACSASHETEQVDEKSSALTGTDVTPTSLSQVSDLRNIPSGVEGLDKVFDNNTSTKLYLGRREEWLAYRLTRPAIVTSYDVVSANDFPERDPKNWTLEASNDGVGWVELDRRSDQAFAGRFQTNTYSVSNGNAYLYYRLNISDNLGDKNEDLQLSEFRIGGSNLTGAMPTTPVLSSAIGSGNSVSLSWGTVSGATGYYVQRIADDGKGTIEALTTSTSYTDSNLAPGASYVYQIQAIAAGVRSYPSARSARVTTAAPAPAAKDVTALSSSAPSDQYATTGVEGVLSVTDNNPYTKYYTGNSTTWITQQTASGAVVTQYTITSGNDFPERDPKSWVLEGSTDGTNWTALDTRSNQGFIGRFQKRLFTCNPSNTPYNRYRLRVTANHGAGDTQLAEWRLLGSVSSSLAAPAAPANLSANPVTNNQIVVSWSDNAGALNPEDSFVVEQATNNAFTANLSSRSVSANSTSYRASALAPGQTYFFRVRAANAAGNSSLVGPVQATTPSTTPPASFVESGWYGGHNRTVYRSYLDSQVAVYFDQYVPGPNSITWLNPLFSEAWAYTKATYGSFSDPILYVIANQDDIAADVNDVYSVGGIQDVFNPDASYRNIIFSVSSRWQDGPDWTQEDAGWNFGSLIHEMSHIVEGNNNGSWGSPSYGVWEDSKWAEIFVYDVVRHLTSIPGEVAAQHEYNKYITSTDTHGHFWFRDWFYPLYSGTFGNTASANKGTAYLSKYYQLLSQYFPKSNVSYSRGLNLGEFIHFSSAAAGVDLEAKARLAFGNSVETELQLARAQQEFPAVYALYNGGGVVNQAPVFTVDPIPRNASVNVALTGQTLVSTATDPNGDSLVYAKDSGPTWLSVSSSGVLSGTPTSAGVFSAVVRVTDAGGLFDTAVLTFTVSASASTPCADLCSAPVQYTGQNYNSGNLGSGATCHETVANLQGLVCGNFASSRTFRINGSLVTCGGSAPPLPAKRNGGYCMQASAGDYAWAYFASY